jgi:hypothetical protein
MAESLPSTVKTSQVATILGYSDRHIRQLAADGVLQRAIDENGKPLDGHFPFPAAVQQFIKFQKESAAIDDDERELNRLKISILSSKDEKDKLLLSVLKNDTHRAEDVRQIFGEMAVTIRSRLQAMPHAVAPNLQGLDSIPAIIAELNKGINNVLVELADYNAADFAERSKDEKIVDQDAVESAQEMERQFQEIYAIEGEEAK